MNNENKTFFLILLTELIFLWLGFWGGNTLNNIPQADKYAFRWYLVPYIFTVMITMTAFPIFFHDAIKKYVKSISKKENEEGE